MKEKDLTWVFLEIYGYSVVFGTFLTVLITYFFQPMHNYEILISTNRSGEWIIEMYVLLSGLCCFLVSAFRRFIRPRA